MHTPLVRLFLARVDNPLLTLPFYVLALGLVYSLWTKPGRAKAIFTGMAVGLLIHLYFHYWAYLVLVLILLTLHQLYADKFRSLKVWFYLWISVIAVSLPYFLNYIWLKNNSSSDFFQRLGVEHGYSFRLSHWAYYLLYAGFALVVYFLFWKKQDENNHKKARFWWAFLLVMALVWNIQLVLGFQPELKWNNSIGPVLFTLAAVWSGYFLKRHGQKIITPLLLLLITLIISKKVANTFLFIEPAVLFVKEHDFSKDISDSWSWMENNLSHSSVVISPSFNTSHYLSVYTSLEPYLKPGLSTRISNIDLEERFLSAAKLFNLTRSLSTEALKRGDYNKEDWENIYYNYYRDQTFDIDYRNNFDPKLKEWAVPESKLKEFMGRRNDLAVDWSSTGADYVYYGIREKQLVPAGLSQTKGLELVYKNSGVEIYSTKP